MVHVHLINPDSNSRALLIKLRTNLRRVRLVTSEETLKRYLDDVSTTTYFACARLLRLSQMLTHYRRPLMVNDIDAVFVGSPDRLRRAIGETDKVYLRISRDIPTLWDGCSAGTIYVGPGQESVDAGVALRAFLLHHYQRGTMPWFLDQIALSGLALAHSTGRALSLRSAG